MESNYNNAPAGYANKANSWATSHGYQTQLDQSTLDGFNKWYGDQIKATFDGGVFNTLGSVADDNYAGFKPGHPAAVGYGGSRNYFGDWLRAPQGDAVRTKDGVTTAEPWAVSQRFNSEKSKYLANPEQYINDRLASVGEINIGREDNQNLVYNRATGGLIDMSHHDTDAEGLNQALPILVGLGAMGGLAAAGVGGGIDLSAFGGGVIGGSGVTAALPASEVAAMTPAAAGSIGAATGAFDFTPSLSGVLDGLGGAGGLLSNAGGIIGKIASGNAGIGDYIGAAGLLGDVLGIGGKDKNGGAGTTTSDKTPWGPAQGFILRGLADTAALNDKYKANPMSPEMQKAYQNQAQDANYFRQTMMPNMMNFAQQGMSGGYQRGGSVIPSQQMYTMQQSNPAQVPRYNTPTKGAGLLDYQYKMPDEGGASIQGGPASDFEPGGKWGGPKSSPPAGWAPPYDPNVAAGTWANGDWSTHWDPNALSSLS